MPKTGTTSMQNTFASSENRSKLEKKNFYYIKQNKPSLNKFFKSFMSNDNTKRKKCEEFILKELESVCTENTNPNIIMSSELLYHHYSSNHQVEGLIKFFSKQFDKIYCIVYLRSPVEWSTSFAQQLLKYGRRDWHQLSVQDINPAYRKRLTSYLEFVGLENMIFREFNTDILINNCPIDDFCKIVINQELPILKKLRKNESLSLEAAYFGNNIFRHNKSSEKNSMSTLIMNKLYSIEGRSFCLPARLEEEIKRHTIEDIEWLKKITKIEGLFENKQIKGKKPRDEKVDKLNQYLIDGIGSSSPESR